MQTSFQRANCRLGPPFFRNRGIVSSSRRRLNQLRSALSGLFVTREFVLPKATLSILGLRSSLPERHSPLGLSSPLDR